MYWDGKQYSTYNSLEEAEYWYGKCKSYYRDEACFTLKKREITETDITPL